MNQKRNYQKELEKRICEIEAGDFVPTLLLHSCCAPCSSYVLEYLSNYFKITVFYYNPNITDAGEYDLRVKEQQRLIEKLPARNPIQFIAGAYEPERFFQAVKGLEQEPEGGMRCRACFMLRLEETAKLCKDGRYDCFTTSLTISPLKNAAILNELGELMAVQYDVSFLNSDFKKKNGYKRSTELSSVYGLYRQDYCGCIYSKVEREKQLLKTV